jgi:UDP-glucose 4-epimerase
MRFLNFGRVVDTTVLRQEFGYTPHFTTEQALADYASTLVPVVSPEVVAGVTSRAQGLVHRIGATAGSVGQRLRPTPPPPGLRAVRDA